MDKLECQQDDTIQQLTVIRKGGWMRQPYVNSCVWKENLRQYSGTQIRRRFRVAHASYG
jgi:hypothetical protein